MAPCLSHSCQTVMNSFVIPGQGRLTATFRAECQHQEMSYCGVKEAHAAPKFKKKQGVPRCALTAGMQTSFEGSFFFFLF